MSLQWFISRESSILLKHKKKIKQFQENNIKSLKFCLWQEFNNWALCNPLCSYSHSLIPVSLFPVLKESGRRGPLRTKPFFGPLITTHGSFLGTFLLCSLNSSLLPGLISQISHKYAQVSPLLTHDPFFWMPFSTILFSSLPQRINKMTNPVIELLIPLTQTPQQPRVFSLSETNFSKDTNHHLWLSLIFTVSLLDPVSMSPPSSTALTGIH